MSDRVKLLLVDDNPENLIALEATLEGLGQELVTARSGIEALRYLLDDDFAAILLDVRMPDMDGFETATLIRSRKRSRNTPILFLTGYKNEEHLFRGYDLGAVDFLFKPIVPEILQSKVSVFVELSKNAKLLKRQADDLQRAEASIRAVLEAAPEAMIIFDAAHRIRSVNTEAELLFRYSRNELIDHPVARLSPEWFSVRPGAVSEITCVTSEGILFPAEVSLKPVDTADTGVAVSVIRDITARRLQEENARRITLELEGQVAERTRELMIDIAERKRAEQALRESEQRLRLAMQAAHLGIWRVDLEAGLMQAAAFTSAMLGFEGEMNEIPLTDWKDRIHPDDREAATRDLERCGPGHPEYESEYRVVQLDGGSRWLLARGQLAGDPEERGARILIGVVQDITQLKLAAEAERHRQKLESLGILAGGVAHDFNNILTGILGNASLLLESQIGSIEDQASIRELMGAAERAAQLTRQMLAYSGRGRFVTEPISPGREAEEITPLIRASIPKNVHIEFDLERTPRIDADKGQIQQLLMNLMINGAEAAGTAGGRVRISTRCERLDSTMEGFYPAEALSPGNYVVIEVEDDGHGMTEATKARIFDPFFTTKFTGRGLGLAAVLGIVRGHKGGIQVDSVPGAGTTFRIYFPVSSKAAASGQMDDREALSPGSGTVLIVDDEAAVRNVAKIALERCGYSPLLAEDGAAGVEIFQRDPESISVVLLDMTMPRLGGEETLKRIRTIRPEIPIIVSSGFSESEARARFGDTISGFLQKPYTARQVGHKLASILGQQRAVGSSRS